MLLVGALLTGCGGGGGTTTTTRGAATISGSADLSAAAACFKAGGAVVRGPKPAGRGSAIYAATRDGRQLGLVKAPDARIAGRLQTVFAAAGQHPSPLKSDATAFAVHNGTLSSSDTALLARCTG